jgi:DNA-binding GntR family transcriptional regulator
VSRSPAPTRVARVYAALRADILGGRQQPGARLRFADLSVRYEASMGVVREALTRLQGEGLVESEPQHGFRVVAVSKESLRHLTEARRAIEALVLRGSMEHGDLGWESEVLAAHHRLDRTPQMVAADPGRLSDEWAVAHGAFHLALLAGCPNPILLGTAVSLRDSAELYRRWSVPQSFNRQDIPGEHRAILDAVLAHDADAAAALLTRHIQHTTDILLNYAGSEAVDVKPT